MAAAQHKAQHSLNTECGQAWHCCCSLFTGGQHCTTQLRHRMWACIRLRLQAKTMRFSFQFFNSPPQIWLWSTEGTSVA
eukprot:1150220-Pelagomonas_calceolata.AAC.2